jgi:hypothetical protein
MDNMGQLIILCITGITSLAIVASLLNKLCKYKFAYRQSLLGVESDEIIKVIIGNVSKDNEDRGIQSKVKAADVPLPPTYDGRDWHRKPIKKEANPPFLKGYQPKGNEKKIPKPKNIKSNSRK